ncbi:hypothetical protein PROFUN_16587 [Planoprotostelium fungivorum]|uniref:Uncharacterized protein n=1 Tax=Planoprotostelium fungivorum TaxID=1890364 RepID=A0A2P6MNS3_9EUKA|nr:hypothetical protein PROFUN_16587 [Planoprotostelium fungivorum]
MHSKRANAYKCFAEDYQTEHRRRVFLSGECTICAHGDRALVQVQHADDSTNPPTFSDTPGHDIICLECAQTHFDAVQPCPFCRYKRWRIKPEHTPTPMELDLLEDVPSLFVTPPATPNRQQAQPRPICRQAPVIHHACQWAWERKPARGCRGPLAVGTDGLMYCPLHLPLGPRQAQLMREKERLAEVRAQQNAARQAFRAQKRQQARNEREQREIAERQARLQEKLDRQFASARPHPDGTA